HLPFVILGGSNEAASKDRPANLASLDDLVHRIVKIFHFAHRFALQLSLPPYPIAYAPFARQRILSICASTSRIGSGVTCQSPENGLSRSPIRYSTNETAPAIDAVIRA